MVQSLPFGRHDGMISAYCDSDGAQCLRARKPTSGGVLFTGSRVIKP